MKKILQGICVGSVLCAAGCLSTVDTVENADKSYVPSEVVRLHVETDVSQPVKVNNLRDGETANGFMRISVEFINTSSSTRVAFYQCEWYDDVGMTIPTSLNQWREIRLAGRDARWINFTAPNALAKDYKIRIIEKKN